jgi:3-oxoacyl-[acyl-carrier-protein] synthase III
MAYLDFPDVSLKGVSACVPKAILENKDLDVFTSEEAEKFIASTGVERRRVAGYDICTSDLCYHAAEKLLSDIGWNRYDIDCIIFVSQTPDYDLPATSCLLQRRLGLRDEVVSIDISSGCSGWIYGLNVISAMLSSGNLKRGLLLVGDTILKTCSREDKSTFPLFGDAGTATAIEFEKGEKGFRFHLASDGSGYETIIIPDGGYRNCVSDSSFEKKEIEPGIKRNRIQLAMDGMNVFSFGIKRAPESVNLLMSHFNISPDQIDYFVFHQANKFLNEKIRKKLNIGEEKVPYSLKDFGNTSSASIPLTLLLKSEDLQCSEKNIIACGFGVGLSWGSVYMTLDKLVCSVLVEI